MNQEPTETRLRNALQEQALREVPTTPNLWPAIAARVPAHRKSTARLRWAATFGLLLLLTTAGLPYYFSTLPAPTATSSPATPSAQTANSSHKVPASLPNLVASPGASWIAYSATGTTFQIVAIDIRAPHEILLFYAGQASSGGPIHLERDVNGRSAPSILLPITAVQSLGRLAEFDVGVLRVAWPQQEGVFVLVVESESGRVTPLRELGVDHTHSNYGAFVMAPPAVGQVSVAAPAGADGFRLALLGRSPQAVPPLHIQITADGTVRVLDKATWDALWPVLPSDGRPVPTEDLEHPYFAPTYPPTPRNGGIDPAASPVRNQNLPPPPPTGTVPTAVPFLVK